VTRTVAVIRSLAGDPPATIPEGKISSLVMTQCLCLPVCADDSSTRARQAATEDPGVSKDP
jgi:hypothetical protein